MSFPKIDPKQSFPKLEEEILAYWQKEKVFEQSLEQDSPQGEFKFFDGPPFATGLPHYGHILQGVIKDLIPRYKTMQGYNVPRVWGWDCHGLPVENLIEKDLGLKSKQDIEKYGVDKFNEKCRESVLKYAEEWKKTVKRMGRWIDVENAYKTMDLQYMDSVWWVFGELWKKGLIYEGLKPMHICPRCETPLSNFEVGLNYRDVTDLSATAKFKLEGEPNTFLLAWTTTPWTLPGNVALAVNPNLKYTKLKKKDTNEIFWIAEKLIEEIFGEKPVPRFEYKNGDWILETGNLEEIPATITDGNLEVIENVLGIELINLNLNYKPLFPYFADKKSEGAFRVVAADFVTTDEGTGIVHIAPAFGEDDHSLAKKENLPIIQNVSLDGKFSEEVTDFAGFEVKPKDDPTKTDRKIVEFLGEKIFEKKNYPHSYPFCWRCESPLLNYATSSWFVAVEKIKKDLLAGNEKINWVPEHIQNGRFGKWLEGARDWAISRNRFWGAPLPIWKCEKCGELKCVSSKNELEKLSGEKIKDLHKHFVDEISWKCELALSKGEGCGGEMKRVPEVLDCWFESGSMPFAQFGEKEKAQIPADFIAEAQDQTRGWFYTLHVLATAIQNKPAFSNCVCSGLILAEDGEKMSKSKQNFPPPTKIFDEFGADAMRLYLMNSSVTHAEDLRFSEKGVEETLRSVLLPLWNTFYFFTTYANADGWEVTQNAELKTQNPLDKWILSELNILVREMTENLEKYEIQKAVSPLAKFLDGLTNWYIRRSRRRFWKSENDGDKNEAYTTLFEVLKTVAKLLAPITPFLAEKIWRDLGDGESVHLENWPEVDDSKIDKELSAATYNTRKIVSLGLEIRARNKIKNRQPLQKAIIGTPKETFDLWVRDQIEIIQEELNVKEIIQEEPSKLGEIKLKVNFPVAGTRLGPKVKEVAKALGNRKYDKKSDENHISVHLEDEDISLDMEEVIIGFSAKNPQNTSESEGLVVTLNLEISEDLKLEGQARDLVRVIQDLRKKADYDVSDRIELQLEGAEEILKVHEKYITAETLAEKVTSKLDTPDAEDSLGEIKIGVKKV